MFNITEEVARERLSELVVRDGRIDKNLLRELYDDIYPLEVKGTVENIVEEPVIEEEIVEEEVVQEGVEVAIAEFAIDEPAQPVLGNGEPGRHLGGKIQRCAKHHARQDIAGRPDRGRDQVHDHEARGR